MEIKVECTKIPQPFQDKLMAQLSPRKEHGVNGIHIGYQIFQWLAVSAMVGGFEFS